MKRRIHLWTLLLVLSSCSTHEVKPPVEKESLPGNSITFGWKWPSGDTLPLSDGQAAALREIMRGA